jgi:hypothetical protein
MNYYFTGILITVMVLLALLGGPARSAETQTNTSGSNTSIEGGYTGGATTYASGSTSTTTSTNSSTSNIKSSPPTAAAPSFSAQSQDVCATGMSAGVQTFGLGFSGGKTFRDMNCERIKLAKVLYDFGMKVGSVALLCQDERVFEAMINAGTPCPVDGKIGKEALAIWQKYDFERPDYKTYVKRMKKRDKIDQSIEIIELKKIELESDK